MKHRSTRTQMTLIAAVWTAGYLSLQQPAFADGKCEEVRGKLIDVYSGGPNTSGTVTNGGFLNGTTITVFPPAFVVTPDPNVVSYTGELTITTAHGLLKTSNVYLYNFVTGQGTALGRINPSASTGRFAGATGVLFLNLPKTVGASIPVTYPQDVTGEICFAKQ